MVGDHLPHLVDLEARQGGAGQHFGFLSRLGKREEVQRIATFGGGTVGTHHIVAIGFVHRDAVGHLHNAALDALQLVAGTAD